MRSKDEVLDALLEVFRRDGYDGASLAALSAATGLGRSSLYHWFPGGKEDMAGQVLDRVEAWLVRELVEPLGGAGSTRDRLDAMLRTLAAFYDDGERACVLGRLCASVARDRFRPRLSRLFGRWIDALAGLLVESGQAPATARERAEDAVIRIQGALVLCEGLGDPAPFRRVVGRLRDELLDPAESSREYT